ncbi:polymer-forming cytoskeletal protein [Bdellovibrio bacteriovorus]|uniref:polymer-forming cytoskeletal protein n=1 Tax=Bdellovibrio bacteriovorus TaxID=959 RepID=UPI0035A6102E
MFTKDTIVINEGASVTAQIEADTIVISGRVEGNLFARRRVIMHPPAIFKGTVTSPSLRIDEGVVFEARPTCLSLRQRTLSIRNSP